MGVRIGVTWRDGRSTLVIMADQISELRLTAFKSFRGVALPLAPLAVLIGRNGSGKSNALDGLEVLSRLAKGTEISDALDGASRDAGPVRGGVEGGPPFGSNTFELGVTVRQAGGDEIRLDVRIQARPQVQVLWERLTGNVAGRRRVLLETIAPEPHRADIEAKLWNGKQGRNPHRMFRASHLVSAQLPLRLEGSTEAERCILQTAAAALAVLGGVFHLDPVPHLMRHYVPEQDMVLRRTGENLSAAVARLQHDEPAKFTALADIIKDLPEHEVRAIEIRRGGFGEVMLGLSEASRDRVTMTEIVFLDSSVLFNILQVPYKCSDRTEVVAEFKKLSANGATFVFPVTAVIETGNVIAQPADGHDRRISGGIATSCGLPVEVVLTPWTGVASSERYGPG